MVISLVLITLLLFLTIIHLTDQFAYSVNADNTTCTITGIGTIKETNIIIPDSIDGYSVTSIGANAFYECKSFTSITIPDSVTSIGDSAFSACMSLKEVIIPNSVIEIGQGAFRDNFALQTVVVGNKVKQLSASIFSECSALQQVTFVENSSITHISESAFRSCSFTNIILPNSVEVIEYGAFANATNLTHITIPSSIRILENDIFNNCLNLKNIVIEAVIPPEIYSYTLDGITGDCVIYVQPSSVESYKMATNWSLYADQIFLNLTKVKKDTFIGSTVITKDGRYGNLNWNTALFELGKAYFIEDTPFNVYVEYGEPYPLIPITFLAQDNKEYIVDFISYDKGVLISAADDSEITDGLLVNFYSAKE